LRDFGQPDVLAIGPNNEVYNGHQRLNVWAEQHGPDFEVDVRVSSRQLTEKERERLTVLLHKGAAGEWDFDTLANEFDLDELLEWGFEESDLELDLWHRDEPPEDPGPQIDRAEELQEKWQVQRGQVWQIGRHRLMCGDSTSAEDVGRLLDVAPAVAMCDPPYGMGLDTDYSAMKGAHSMGNQSHSHEPVKGDDEDFDARTWHGTDCPEAFWFGADYYADTLGDTQHSGSWLVWDKRSENLDSMYGSSFELIWSRKRRKREILRHLWAGFFTGGQQREYLHPTEKPPSLYVDLLDRAEDGPMYDPGCGIGASLVACEQTGRIGYGMEIEPKYCAVTLERLTGMGLDARVVD